MRRKCKTTIDGKECAGYHNCMDHEVDIKPILKSEEHFRKWVANYPFYANIRKEGVVLYEAA